MTIPYSPTIPNPPDDPADDVAAMQQNAGSISTIISVDHVGFNTAGGGQHAQVTFNANNVPSPPVTPPVLFTNTVAGLAQLFFYSGNAAHSSTQYVAAGTGSTFLLGGIILKWGTFSTNGSGVATVTFTSAFPNNCYGVVPVVIDSGSVTVVDSAVYAYNSSVSGFSATGTKRTTKAALALNAFYVAIGN